LFTALGKWRGGLKLERREVEDSGEGRRRGGSGSARKIALTRNRFGIWGHPLGLPPPVIQLGYPTNYTFLESSF